MSLQRDRLTALLGEQALTSIELVIAPPGYGKTTVLRDYAASDSGAAFVALPEGAGLETFVRAVVEAAIPAAVRSVGAVFDGRSGHELEEQAAGWLASRLRAFSGTIIIDDFHRTAADDRVTRVLVTTIAETRGRVRWFVASREAPRFPMGSWIARGWMGLPLSADDLRFTPDEAANLAATLGIGAADGAIADIVRDTLGWPIGVRLALGLIARGRNAGATRMQTRDALFALIDDEVWQPLGPALQRTIAAAALMPAPAIEMLAAAGFANARSAMTEIFARVPFVQPIDDDAFIIHDLFREFVAARTPAGTATATDATRIGGALVAGGNAADGVKLLIAAGDIDGLESALAGHAFTLIECGHRTVVQAALDFLTARGRGDAGVALAVAGAFALADGSGANSANFYKRALERDVPASMRAAVARKLAANYYNRGMTREALATLQAVDATAALSADDALEGRALMATMRATIDAAAAAAIENAAIEALVPTVSPPIQARVLQLLGVAAYSCGDLQSAERFSLASALLATSLGIDAIAAMAYGNLCSIVGNSDSDTQRARVYLRAQRVAAERASNVALVIYALRAEYALAAVDGKIAEADAIEETLAGFVDARSFRDTFGYRLMRAMQYIAMENVGKAESTMRTMATSSLTRAERACYDAFSCVLFLIRGRRSDAEAILARGLVTEVSENYWGEIEIARAYALRGLALWSLGRRGQARKAFEFDIRGLPPRQQVFVKALQAVTELPLPLPNIDAIAAMCRQLADANLASFAVLLRLLVANDANDVELSPAEIETLRMFDRYGGRAADVAKALGKSKFTVQNQIQSAIRKLGCSGRAEALAYARQRGWLDKTTS